MPLAVRLVLHGAAAGAGVLAGVLGSFVHPVRTAGLPGGLMVALALCAAVFVAAGLLAGARTGAAAAAAGWLLPVLLFSAPRPEGDLVVPGTAAGYAWLLGGTVVAALAVARPYGSLPASSAQGTDGR